MLNKYSLLCRFALFIYLIIPLTLSAQINTRDFLTNSTTSLNSPKKSGGNIEVFAFSSNADYIEEPRIRDVEYLEMNAYFTFHLFSCKNYRISLAFTYGVVAAGDAGARGNWGDPWIWVQYRPLMPIPIELRAALNFNSTGGNIWVNDDKLDLGILYCKKANNLNFLGISSFRFRDRSKDIHHMRFGDYNELGREFYYQGEVAYRVKNNNHIKFTVTGYRGSDKALNGATIISSYSRKISTGLAFQHESEKIHFVFGFLIDIEGRYDKKGKMFFLRRIF